MKKYFLLLLTLQPFWILAQHTDTLTSQSRVFQLGEVLVLERSADSLNALSIRKIEKFNRTEISQALNLLAGVSLANVGPRNESVVYVRGFDLRQVPVFIDGIPVYVPYDGYVDMGRFNTFDLAEINVSKGFASILYGANTMGGAINLVSRKPQNKFEIDGTVGAFSGKGYRWNVNTGSNFGKFYYQFGLSQIKQEFFPVSSDFDYNDDEVENGRANSHREDVKLSVKVGFTPNDKDEYVVGYIKQQGEKGTPPYLGEDSRIMTRYWQWPRWDKESLYFITNTALGKSSQLKTRWFYDAFENELFSYDDSTYSSMTRPYAFQSYYDDYTLGGIAELESRRFKDNLLKFSVQIKRDLHRENNLGEPQRSFIDHTMSFGIENTYTVTPSVFIVPGVSLNTRKSLEAQDYISASNEIVDFPANDNSAVNAQVGIFWDIKADHHLRGSISRKTRFATIKDRYSYRMGAALPNPDLAAEVAANYDITYVGKPFDGFTINSSFYRSDISNIIQQVDDVEPGRFQLQNAGNALFYGLDLELQQNIGKGLVLGGNYSYIQRKNLTDPELLFIHVPDHKVFGYLDYSFLNKINLLFSTEYNSQRFSTSYGTVADAYTLLNTKINFQVYKYLQFEGGINNLLDTNYTIMEGFPEAGRNFFVNLVFRNF